MQSTYQKQSKVKLVTTIVAIIVIAGVVVIADHLKSNDKTKDSVASTGNTTQSAQPTSNTNTSTQTTAPASASSFKDGTYTTSKQYFVPAGNETIKVTVTIKDGTITASSIENSESDRESADYQQEFAAGYKKFVIGKKIDGLKIGSISGASDTTDGFNEALAEIASQAKV